MTAMFRLALAAIAAVWSLSAAAKEIAVDLELVLAVDVSGSIDEEEARLQREGYVGAIIHPEVLDAIKGGMLQRIAVTYIEWAGLYRNTLVGWSLIQDEESATAFAGKLAEAPIFTASWTSISNAINYSVPLFDSNGYSGIRRVVDISGDGPNNEGEPVTLARDRALAAGIVINGLPIINDRPSPFGYPSYRDLDKYYINCVIGGAGAFVVVADTHRDFARAIRKKLVLEIADRRPAPAGDPARPRLIRVAGDDAPPPCNIGEERRKKYWREADDF